MFSLFDTPMYFDTFGDPFIRIAPRRRRIRLPPVYYYLYSLVPDEEEQDEVEQKPTEQTNKPEQKDHESQAKDPVDDAEKEKVQEKNLENEKSQEPVISRYRTRSVISRRNGVEHIRKEVFDSNTGITTQFETRKIGDKSMTLKRETDKDGNVHEEESRENISDEELEEFKNQWMTRTSPKELPSNSDEKSDNIKKLEQKEGEKKEFQ